MSEEYLQSEYDLEEKMIFNISNSSFDINSEIGPVDYGGEDLIILMQIVPFLVPILFTIIIFIGLIGNLLVVFVVVLNRNMRNTTNLLILNLAVSLNNYFE